LLLGAATCTSRLADGQVLAAGGEFKNWNGTFSILSSAELYTP
jgi:hypothetical protein